MRQYINEHLEKGFIRPSRSPFTLPILFIKKPRKGLKFYVNYWALNAITI